MSTRRDDSLRRGAERWAPTPRLPRGNHPWSAFESGFYYIGQDDGLLMTPFDQGDDVDILLFMVDFPCHFEAWSFYHHEHLPFDNQGKDYTELSFLNPMEPSGNLILHENEATLGLQQQITGLSVTNAVPVWGYLFQGQVLDRTIGTGTEPFVPGHCHLRIEALSMAEVRYGPPEFRQTALQYLYSPCILAETDYTQAMADAGNIYNVTIGPVTYNWVICGLYMKGSRA